MIIYINLTSSGGPAAVSASDSNGEIRIKANILSYVSD